RLVMPLWPTLLALQVSDSATAAALTIPAGSVSRRFLLTAGLIVTVVALSALFRNVASRLLATRERDKPRFWTEQTVSLIALVTIVVGLLRIWFDDPQRLTGALGLAIAGVAVALQRVITAFAGYIVILRGNIFTVGDRIVMDGIRGDVISLGFIQTTVMEMGQSKSEQPEPPAVWVSGRMYTGRIVRITNDRIFDSPVFNYTKDFPFVWEEIQMPIHHEGQKIEAERILLAAAHRLTDPIVKEAVPALARLRRKFFLPDDIEMEPKVYYRLTDNWIELSLRFVSHEPGVRDLKDAIYREILEQFREHKIDIASSSSEVSIVSPVRIEGAALR
ncbi:MAG TPA: mechanosensitive ion channel family protein, partial [Gemmatimonadaceae bacterium]